MRSAPRRELIKHALWIAPTAVVAVSTPAYASSPGVVGYPYFYALVTSNNSTWGQTSYPPGMISTITDTTPEKATQLSFVGANGGDVTLNSATVTFTFTNSVTPTATVDPFAFAFWNHPTDLNGWKFAQPASNKFVFTAPSDVKGTIGTSLSNATNFANFFQNFNLGKNVNSGTFLVTTEISLTYTDALGQHSWTQKLADQPY